MSFDNLCKYLSEKYPDRIEFQVQVITDPPLPLRMLDYWVRPHRRYRLSVTQVLVLLKPPAMGITIESEFRLEGTQHPYRVVRMWEEDPEVFLQDPALLPLAVLAGAQNNYWPRFPNE
jgi:predicted transposase YdaD